MSWRWITKQALLLLHAESLAEHGGSAGIRDECLLDSALASPQNLLAYGEPDLATLAASYGVGVARNHPFIDGNKRAALLSIGLFLHLNGWRLTAGQAETTRTMLGVAAGTLKEDALADWLRRHGAPRG
ncbi:MAG: death-on-curing protein [Comamonas sp. SCN 65-56]|uniref:type II toxin-antitoxin system death-on-curing family toxin n=1 Tax=Comamonas sp. SCN 65-56 TaxID=1660095 RepID=UPI00086A5C34|nr:type II toxin-antitoxin system death-on-curing family toxin [Comamonas sp. SCN 65-56]ODS90935.1 MAG: death-on-curing protein [Comamonas sp. SCN 65-56]